MNDSKSSSNSSRVRSVDLNSSHGYGQPKYKVGANQTSTNGKTPRPNMEDTTKTNTSYMVMAIYESHLADTKGLIGIASMDIRYCDIDVSEFLDSATYTRLIARIQIEDPLEVVVAESLTDKTTSAMLLESIKNAYPNLPITMVHKRFFNEDRGRLLVQQLANTEVSTVDVAIRNEKKVAMAALATLVKYVEQIQHVIYSGKCVRFTYSDPDKVCMMDCGSWTNLEVIGGGPLLGNKKEKRSLLSLLDNTQTFSGSRLLRSNLLQPCADVDVINARLDAVEELVGNERIMESLRKLLSMSFELESVLSIYVNSASTDERSIKYCENRVLQTVRLRKTMDIVFVMRTALENAQSKMLLERKAVVNDKRVDEMIGYLDEYIDPGTLSNNKKTSIAIKNQKIFAIKEGINIKLDISRRAYNELINDMQGDDDELKQYLPCTSARLGYSINRGFHYSWSTRESSTMKMPSVFFDVVRNRYSLTFTSRKLMRYNDRIEQFSYDIMQISDTVITKLMEKVRPLVGVLYHLLDTMSLVDFLCSLATYSVSADTVRPRFGSGILVNAGYHPLLERTGNAIPNDTYMPSDSRFSIITGPNMAGKSTYLKQVCLLAMMAQVGCMVPAVNVTFPVFKRMFSRVGHNDDINKRLSAFALEMSEMSVILQFADDCSLIVIDELARSTSTEEGIGISYAIAESLLQKDAFCILATHFLDLSGLDLNYPQVENYHFHPQVLTLEDGTEALDATHKLQKGAYNGPLYGLDLAELAGFPEAVITEAKLVAQQLRADADKKKSAEDIHSAMERRAYVRCFLRLKQAVKMAKRVTKEQLELFMADVKAQLKKSLGEMDKFRDSTVGEGSAIANYEEEC